MAKSPNSHSPHVSRKFLVKCFVAAVRSLSSPHPLLLIVNRCQLLRNLWLNCRRLFCSSLFTSRTFHRCWKRRAFCRWEQAERPKSKYDCLHLLYQAIRHVCQTQNICLYWILTSLLLTALFCCCCIYI